MTDSLIAAKRIGEIGVKALISRRVWLGIAIALQCVIGIGASAQTPSLEAERGRALKNLLHTISTPPYYALGWHELKLAVVDSQSAAELRDALLHSGRSPAGAMEQSLWVDAAAGHPEAALAFYDANVKNHPSDKSFLNTACWARAAHGLDLAHVMTICDDAVAADSKGYTLVSRGKAELQLGLFQKALSDFNEALADRTFRSHPMFVDAVYGRGIARIRLGDADGSQDIKLAVRATDGVATTFADIGISP